MKFVCECWIYQTWETVFQWDIVTPRRGQGWQYNVQQSIFDEIQGVWLANETLSPLLDMSSQSKQKQRPEILKIYVNWDWVSKLETGYPFFEKIFHKWVQPTSEIVFNERKEIWRCICTFIIWQAPRADKMNQITCCDWLPERARWSHLAHLGLPAVSHKQNFTKSDIINPLLTKFVRSRWLNIGLVLFLRVYWPGLRLGP